MIKSCKAECELSLQLERHSTIPTLGDLRPNPDWARLPLFDRKGWQTLTFEAFADSVNERVEPSEAAEEIYVGLEHLDSQNLHIRRWGKGSDVIGTKLRFRKGDIIFGRRRAYQRKLAVAEFDGICSAHAMIVRAKLDVVLPEFLPFLMMSDRFMNRAVEISVGSLSPTINWKTLKLQEFDLPPLDQQRRIAEMLWAVDELLCSLKNIEEILNQGLFAERDGFFSTCSKEKMQRVDKLFDVQLGKMLSQKARMGISPLPYLGNKNVQWGCFDLTEVLEMDFSQGEFQKFNLSVGDLLVCEGGEVGRCAIWDGAIQDCCFQKALHRLRTRNSAITPEYMLEFMFWADMKGLFTSLTGHSTIAHLPAIKLKSMQVPLADAIEQRQFVKMMGEYRSVLRVVAERYEDTRTLRDVFIDAILGGQS